MDCTMKRISIFLATAAIAALATLSCNKNELNVPDGPVGPKVSVRISGAPEDAREVDPSTRTFINENNGSYTAKWSNEGEALGLILGDIDANSKPVLALDTFVTSSLSLQTVWLISF